MRVVASMRNVLAPIYVEYKRLKLNLSGNENFLKPHRPYVSQLWVCVNVTTLNASQSTFVYMIKCVAHIDVNSVNEALV